MDHLQLQSAFKFVAISRFGDGGQLMTAANLCLEAVLYCIAMSGGFDVTVGSTVLTKSRKTAVFYHKIHKNI